MPNPSALLSARQAPSASKKPSESKHTAESKPTTTWPGYAAAFVAGLLFAFGLAPYGLWPITLLSVVALILLLNPKDNRLSTKRALAYGLGMFAHGMSWVFISIYTYGNTPIFIALPMTASLIFGFALFFTAQIYLFQRLNRSHLSPLSFPALWVLFDLLRSWVLTGCPWLYAGYAFIDTPLVGYAPVFGIYGVTYFAILTATLLAKCFEYLIRKDHPKHHTAKNHTGTLICLLLLLALWGGGELLKQKTWVEIDPRSEQQIDVSLIQGNISQDQKWLPEQFQPTLKLYYDATDAELLDETWHPDLILWPEAALPGFKHELNRYFDELNQRLNDEETTLITGVLFAIPKLEEGYIFHNSVIALGKGEGTYHKQKLVPFGEVYPFAESLKSIIPFYGQMQSFTPGRKDQPLLSAGDAKIAPFICYEIIYPDFVRRNVHNADLLLTISNDAWFGDSIAPWQHFEMARMRAIENGRSIIRGTNTGITGIITHTGDVISTAPQFERLAHRGTAYRASGTTPYTRFGNLPLTLLTSLLLILSMLIRRSHA